MTRRVPVDGGDVEVERIVGDESLSSLVFLHEGLGSVSLWREFPADLAAATGRSAVVWSRLGHGRSDPNPRPRDVDYMHHEALDSLPRVLAACDADQPVLVGHSDGASIALIYAGSGLGPISSLVLLAPHVFVEDESIAGIEAARTAFLTTDLAHRMAKHHDDVDETFWRWNETWLSHGFRAWNIEHVLPSIDVPVLLVQGTDDRYGTLAQLDAIEQGVSGRVVRLELDGCGHAPHLERAAETLGAVTAFLA